jgi:Tol biopolymer transport system component
MSSCRPLRPVAITIARSMVIGGITIGLSGTSWTAAPIKLNGPLVANGNVSQADLAFSPDSSRVLYRADQTTNDVFDIYSVPSVGGIATKLNTALVAGGGVQTMQFSPDSSRVLYRADQFTNDLFEIFVVPSAGGTPQKLNGALVVGGDVTALVQFSPDSSYVLYVADQTTDEVFEIFSVPSAGGVPTKLNGSLVSGGDVFVNGFVFSPDSSRVLYRADQTTDEVFEIFSVPSAGGVATKLNGTLVAGGNVSLNGFAFSPDSSRVLYVADQITDEVLEIFSVPSAGGVATKLNGALVGGGDVNASFLISPDSSRVVYNADQITDEVLEIFSVSSAGGVATKLNSTLVAGGDAFPRQFSPDSSRVLYLADQTTDEVFELFSVPSAGGVATKLNGALVVGGDVTALVQFSPDSTRVVYLADQTTDGVNEIYSVPSAGGTAQKLNGTLTAGGNVANSSLQFSPDSSRVIYLADQTTDEVQEVFIVPSEGGVATKLNGDLVAGGDVIGTVRFSPDGSLVLYLADQQIDEVTEVFVRIVVQHSLAGAGNWDAGAAWNRGGAPDDVMQIYIDAPGTIAASGVGTRTVNELVVGGGVASSTLALASGAAIESLHGVTIENNGVVRGNGVLVAGLGGLAVAAGGEIQAVAGDRLSISSPNPVVSAGRIEAIGTAASLAEIEFDSALTNGAGTGSIVSRNAILCFNGGLTNHSAIALSFGTTDVMGDVTNSATGTIAVAGNSGVTFYDDVTNSGTLNVAGGSTAVFFGALAGNGNIGSGNVQALGDLLPGASPGIMSFGGDLTMGPLSNLTIEIAGTALGQFDRLVVAGDAALAGALDIEFDGFSLALGQSFEILDIGGVQSGTFFGLAEGAPVGNFGGTDLFVTYAGGDGNDVVLFTIGLPGDFDFDGDVDGRDFLTWQRNTSVGDLADWQNNYGVGMLTANSTAVPEPAHLVLYGIFMILTPHRRVLRSPGRDDRAI